MDNQEAFNRVVTHLRRQGRKSGDPSTGFCKYRSAEGLRCAAGVLLTDEFYEPRLEGFDVVHLSDVFGRALPHVDIRLIRALQIVHDGAPVHVWERGFNDVAQRWGLTMPIEPADVDAPAPVEALAGKEA